MTQHSLNHRFQKTSIHLHKRTYKTSIYSFIYLFHFGEWDLGVVAVGGGGRHRWSWRRPSQRCCNRGDHVATRAECCRVPRRKHLLKNNPWNRINADIAPDALLSLNYKNVSIECLIKMTIEKKFLPMNCICRLVFIHRTTGGPEKNLRPAFFPLLASET